MSRAADTQWGQWPWPLPPPPGFPFNYPFPHGYSPQWNAPTWVPYPPASPVDWGYGSTPSYPLLPQPPKTRHPPTPPPTPPDRNSPVLPPIHEYWKGRITAPLGHREETGLDTLPVDPKRPSDKSLKNPTENQPKFQLLPPRSYQQANVPSFPDPRSETDFRPLQASPRDDRSSTTPHKPNKYADIFIPQWLRDIQNQMHVYEPLPSLPPFPTPSYLSSFIPATLLSTLLTPPSSHLLSSPPPPLSSSPPTLSPESYSLRLTTLLSWELDTLLQAKQQAILWKRRISVGDWARSEFVLEVHGLRENVPRLEVGDLVIMREVLEKHSCGTGRGFQGRIVRLMKTVDQVHMYCPSIKAYIQANNLTASQVTPDLQFNVSFILNARPLFCMQAAVAALAASFLVVQDDCSHPDEHNQQKPSKPSLDVNSLSITASTSRQEAGTHMARRWLFPAPDDMEEQAVARIRNASVSDFEWVDKGLNNEQRNAVSCIALHRLPVPYLISGPPGTGKTRTVVETVLQILRLQPESCILLCAPSNPATDTLAARLRHNLRQSDMFRLNDPNRAFASVPDHIKPYCHIEDSNFALPKWETLMKFRVVVCSCIDASILVAAQCTNAALGLLEANVIGALHPHRKLEVVPHWTHLIIDEAAQGPEPELLIPISVVNTGPPREDVIAPDPTNVPQLILCGDPNQLGPIVTSQAARDAELDVSLLERLFERPLYANHSLARANMHGNITVHQTGTFAPFTNLVKNYRSHPAILMPPSTIFYNDSLEPCADNGFVSWSKLPNQDLPLVFFGSVSEEESPDERASWYNAGEIDKVVSTITSLLEEGEKSSPPLLAEHIGVMAPWRGQVWKIREALRERSLRQVDVGTVEDFQGRESRVIIISCVRSRTRFLKEDGAKGLGVVFERKRMNVAITRAKELLVVIGNAELLCRDPYWKGFLQFALRHKLYVGPELKLDCDGLYMSRLESAYVNVFKKDKELAAEEQGAFLVGGLAREVLTE